MVGNLIKLHKIDFYIPLYFNDGTTIDADIQDTTKTELINIFGGLTEVNNINGYWINDKQLYTDRDIILSVVTDIKILDNGQTLIEFLVEYKTILENRYKQKEIFITRQEIDII